jgi:N-acetylglucosaminyldiphosphoundecaprenol N-acetyl-beta-D-mannosaminyltransferase
VTGPTSGDTAVNGDHGRVGNISFSVMPLHEAITLVRNEAALVGAAMPDGSPRGRAIHFANAYNVALARSDHAYATLLERGDYVFSDGVPITWVGRRAYPALGERWERVYGPDVMTGVLAASTEQGPLHYLLGGSPETLAALETHIAAHFPTARVVGAESPPFAPATADELTQRDERIRQSGASIVWVGLGTPKQDAEVRRLADTLPVVAMAVGAAFDFLAGTKAQAPAWMQRNGLEWAFRLGSEPRRLGRRYVWGNGVFLAEAARTLAFSRRAH